MSLAAEPAWPAVILAAAPERPAAFLAGEPGRPAALDMAWNNRYRDFSTRLVGSERVGEHPGYVGAEVLEVLHEPRVAAVDVLDVPHLRHALGAEAREHQPGA